LEFWNTAIGELWERECVTIVAGSFSNLLI